MIARYTRPHMGAIWTQQRKYECWLEVELAVCQAMEGSGDVPRGVSKRVRKKVTINLTRIAAIEQITKHDVIAFLESVAEQAGKDAQEQREDDLYGDFQGFFLCPLPALESEF